jgi:DNA-binding XRE family transcriptional regulator
MMGKNIKTEWNTLFNESTFEEQIAINADVLTLQFMGLADEKMKETGMTKKELADRIDTSSSFLTQLLRGDRKPSWELLAKLALVLGLNFKVVLKEPICKN